jgi:hypothetical protein
MLHGPDEAAGHGVAGQVEMRVDGGDEQVETGEELVVPVQGAVGLDVQLRAVEEDHPAGCLQRPQPDPLLERLAFGHALHGEEGGVVGDGAVAVATGFDGRHHVLEAGQTVGEVGVHVQVAAQVGHLDELW